ncbi:CheY-like superfamily [Phascolomyces articulosus]|uniref:CheY-like superfamily n=1 Tax=Phascolomyces articulosus TaxID=60185 RepID=A0AAD5K761_9FUNG|nr:CheY-like superfamily [Phascolomyces articulosus]
MQKCACRRAWEKKESVRSSVVIGTINKFFLPKLFTLDYFAYSGRRASTGSALFHPLHHRRHSASDESSTTPPKRPQYHRRRPSQTINSNSSNNTRARYSFILPPSPLSTTTTFAEAAAASAHHHHHNSSTSSSLPPLLTPSSAVSSPLSPPLTTPPVLLDTHILDTSKCESSSSSTVTATMVLPTPTAPMVPRTTSPTSKRSTQPPTTGVNVLLVDDNHVNLQVLSRVLRHHMADTIHHIEQVKSGLKALEILHRQPFDLILLDIDMPILSGVDTARHIRSSTEYDILLHNRNIPIVAVTTNDTADWKRAFAQVGMNGCISKPVVANALKKTLHQVLNYGCSPESLAAS